MEQVTTLAKTVAKGINDDDDDDDVSFPSSALPCAL